MQVYRYLQQFMVCMSPSSSTKIIEELADSYDEEVLLWTNEIGKVTKKFGHFVLLHFLNSTDC